MKYLTKILIIFLLSMNLYATSNIEKVTVQLDWKYQFEYAGFIMAIENGYYGDAGLEVSLLEYEDNIDIANSVLSKKVDFGMSNSSIMSKNGYLLPTVILATYFQKSPLVLITNLNIKKPSDLSGKRIMLTKDEHNNSSLSLLLKHFFINYTYVPHTYNIKDFQNHKVDAMSAFTTNELYALNKKNIDYNIIYPADYGFTTSAVNIFTSYDYAKNHIFKIKKFLKATKKGWEYALGHISETANIIHKKYAQNKSIEALRDEAQIMQDSMLLGLYDIGEVNKDLTKRTYKQLTRSGMLKKGQKLDKLIFDDILQEQKNKNFKFNEQEKKYLIKKKIINLCVDPNWMPFEAIKDGKHIGIFSDYFHIFKQKLGIEIKLYPTKSWTESLDVMKQRKCDVLSGATETKERLKYMNFTKAYIKSPLVIATKENQPFIENIKDIKDKKIGVTKGYIASDILKRTYNGINLVEVENIFDGLSKVENGELYGYAGDLMAMAYSIQKYFVGSIKVSARLDKYDYNSVATRSDEPILNNIFAKLIKSISDKQKQKILNNWIVVKESVDVNYKFLKEILIIFAIIIIIGLVYFYQLRKYNKILQKSATTDTLTGISNRLKLDQFLELNQNNIKRHKFTCGLIMIDIDDFKSVNDLYGHLVGDEILKQVALTLKYNIREVDMVGRWGGEEFLIVCPHTTIENLKKIAENLKKKIEQSIFSKKQHITASFGLSSLDGIKLVEEVLNEADKALYLSKINGKNMVSIYSHLSFDL